MTEWDNSPSNVKPFTPPILLSSWVELARLIMCPLSVGATCWMLKTAVLFPHLLHLLSDKG